MAYQKPGQIIQSSDPQKLLQLYQQILEQTQSRKVEQVVSDQPIIGLRVWKVVDDRGLPKLRSVYKETIWPYRKALEKDILDNMGIHAVKPGVRGPSIADSAAVCTGVDVLSLFSSYQADIAGEVYLWGHVSEHEHGYLAEFAYPKKIYPHADFDPIIAMQLEDEYGVPCEYRPEFVKPQKQIDVYKTPGIRMYPQGLLGNATAAAIQMQQYQGLQQMQANFQAASSNAMMYGTALFKCPWQI